MRNEQTIFVQKPEGKILLHRPRRRWEGNIQMSSKNMIIGCGLYSSGPGDGPQAGSCENSNELSRSLKGGKFLDQLSEC
jgi:hypothetical protein